MELFAVVIVILAGQIGSSVRVTYKAAREGEGGGSALVHALICFLILLMSAAVVVGFGWDGTGWIFVVLPAGPALQFMALVVARRLGATHRAHAMTAVGMGGAGLDRERAVGGARGTSVAPTASTCSQR